MMGESFRSHDTALLQKQDRVRKSFFEGWKQLFMSAGACRTVSYPECCGQHKTLLENLGDSSTETKTVIRQMGGENKISN